MSLNLDISSRPKRRRAVDLIIKQLSLIRDNESSYRDRIPDNLSDSDAALAADDSIDFLSDAIFSLQDAY